jgi:hypothetical protein
MKVVRCSPQAKAKAEGYGAVDFLGKPLRGALTRRALLLRRHDATDFLELVAHRPNSPIRDVGRIGKPFATYHE